MGIFQWNMGFLGGSRYKQLILKSHPEVDAVFAAYPDPFRSKISSTLYIDWKPRDPEHCALYFQCTTKLVDTFRLVFGLVFAYEGTRAILFHMDQPLPETEIKACIRATLMYHKVKHLDMLGM
jgi:hypothetical protein